MSSFLAHHLSSANIHQNILDSVWGPEGGDWTWTTVSTGRCTDNHNTWWKTPATNYMPVQCWTCVLALFLEYLPIFCYVDSMIHQHFNIICNYKLSINFTEVTQTDATKLSKHKVSVCMHRKHVLSCVSILISLLIFNYAWKGISRFLLNCEQYIGKTSTNNVYLLFIRMLKRSFLCLSDPANCH